MLAHGSSAAAKALSEGKRCPGSRAIARSTTASSSGDSGNLLRATFQLPAAPATVARARLYVAGLGYFRATLNGAPTDAHELGTFTEFERRVLYDVADVAALLRPGGGCNALGVELDHN